MLNCLHSFYTTNINFNDSLYIISKSNAYEFHSIQIVSMNVMEGEDKTLKKWIGSMRAKFDKYYDDVDKMNKYLFIMIVFDSMYKLKYLKFIFKHLYWSHIVERLVNKVNVVLNKLFKVYYNGK